MSRKMTFEEASSTVLAPWFSGEPPKPDIEAVGDAKVAATHAFVTAINAKGQRGVVRVVCPDAESVKAVRNYLVAFFEVPGIRDLFSKATADGVELKGGLSIEATSNPQRLARNVISTILLVERNELPITIDTRDMARAILDMTRHVQDNTDIETLLGLPEGYFAARDEEARQEQAVRWEADLAERKAEAAKQAKPETSVPIVPRAAEDPVAHLVDGIDYFSVRWEQTNSLRRMGFNIDGDGNLAAPRRPPKVLHRASKGKSWER